MKMLIAKYLHSRPAGTPEMAYSLGALARLAGFFTLLLCMCVGVDSLIDRGLRRITTSRFGSWNRVMQQKVNARLIVSGSSRAASHYDPRILEARTGLQAFNIGRNGTQTDLQLAVLKAYLARNRKPDLIIHNLDAFSFVTTKELYDSVLYVPYLHEEELYRDLSTLKPDLWRSRYIPLYGYVVDDMSFSWLAGLGAWLEIMPREDFVHGFDPRARAWTDEFRRFRAANPDGVRWEVEERGVVSLEQLANLCKEKGIELALVYSPEYAEMQRMTKNRSEIFSRFRDIAHRQHCLFLDFSSWRHSGDTTYFTNSQHLNLEGATAFSNDLAETIRERLLRAKTIKADSGLTNVVSAGWTPSSGRIEVQSR